MDNDINPTDGCPIVKLDKASLIGVQFIRNFQQEFCIVEAEAKIIFLFRIITFTGIVNSEAWAMPRDFKTKP